MSSGARWDEARTPWFASPLGYGYQWWLPDASGAFCAMGVYNQFVYVDPARALVIAKFSAAGKF